MLQQKNRLTSKFEFNITRKYGQYYKGACFHGYYLVPRNYQGPPKIGIIISTKVHKNATKRNRLKRVFREILRHQIEHLNNNLWLIFYPKVVTLNKNYEEINLDIIKFIQKISLPR